MRKVIDTVNSIEIEISQYNNELQSLTHLQSGLIYLYNNVKHIETKITLENPDLISFSLNAIGLPNEVFNLLPGFFHWYGISICNYARLIGFLVSREQGLITDSDLYPQPNIKKIKYHCDTYIKSINEIEQILKWRNKVAAHFALTDPRFDDNIATMEASIIYPVSFVDNRFMTGAEIYGRSDGNNLFESAIPQWSLTESFELIARRYWPEIQFIP